MNVVYKMVIKHRVLGQKSMPECCYWTEFTGTCVLRTTQNVHLNSWGCAHRGVGFVNNCRWRVISKNYKQPECPDYHVSFPSFFPGFSVWKGRGSGQTNSAIALK